MINTYDLVRLKSGERARILEMFSDGDFIAEVISKSGDVDTVEIKRADISAKIVEIEQPINIE